MPTNSIRVEIHAFEKDCDTQSRLVAQYDPDPTDWAITLRGEGSGRLYRFDENGRELLPCANIQWRILPDELAKILKAKFAAYTRS